MNSQDCTTLQEGLTIYPEGIEILREKGLVILTIAREEDLNRITLPVLKRLHFITQLLKEDAQANVLLIKGQGQKVFSFGLLNPALRASMSKDAVVQLVRYANEVFNDIEALPQVVICAINGRVIAGGFELTLACDLRYAAEQVTMQLPEAGWGGFPGAGAPFRLPMIVGAAKALEIICLGDDINAKQMLDWGIVQAVFTQEEFDTNVIDIAKKINSKGPLAIKGTKRIIRTRMMSGFTEAAELSKALRHSLEWSKDVDEGILAHQENRSPQFTGI